MVGGFASACPTGFPLSSMQGAHSQRSMPSLCAQAMAFAAIGVILFAPRADQAYSMVLGFTIGTSIGAIFAAVVAFAVLPNTETFGAFSIALGLVLVPAGAGVAQS